MYIESKIKPQSVTRTQKFLYVISSFAIIILKIVDLALHNWFTYCWWDFGLIYGGTFTSFKNFQNENSINDVQNDACESIRALVSKYCPSFCEYISNFEEAGLAMMFFGVISIVAEVICLAFHLWNFFYHSFRFKKIWAIMALPKFLYILGFLIWFGVSKPHSINSVHSGPRIEGFKFKEGFYLAIIILVLDMLLMLYGLLKTRKAFLPNK